MNMPESILTDFKTEGDPAFPVEEKEKEDSSVSSTVKETNSDQTHSSEGESNSDANKDVTTEKPVDNFADHPRWKERESDWTKRFNEQETRHLDEITKLRQELDSRLPSADPAKQETAGDPETSIPAWFGGDETQWKDFTQFLQKDLLTRIKKDGVAEVLKEIETKKKSEDEAITKATEYMNSEIEAIEKDPTLNPTKAKIDKNRLLKIVDENNLIDKNGNWNYRLGWKIMSGETSTAKPNNSILEKKKIAGASVFGDRTEDNQQNYTSSSEFEKPGAKPW